MATQKDRIKDALENVSQAANILSIHGYNGYNTESSALDVVFVRALAKLRSALYEDNASYYDPIGMLMDSLPHDDHF